MTKKINSLQDYQAYVREKVKKRGFDDETPEQIFTLLVEEVGLAKAFEAKEQKNKTRKWG